MTETEFRKIAEMVVEAIRDIAIETAERSAQQAAWRVLNTDDGELQHRAREAVKRVVETAFAEHVRVSVELKQ